MSSLLTITCLLTVTCVFASNIFNKFGQNDYKGDFRRVELVRYNTSSVTTASVLTFKLNRTTTAINITFSMKIEVNEKTTILLQMYKMASNEYRYFPMRFMGNLCESFQNSALGIAGMLNGCGNVDSCHFKKNIGYYVCNFVPDFTRMPPHFPSGELMLEGTFCMPDCNLATFRLYINIYRPVKIKN